MSPLVDTFAVSLDAAFDELHKAPNLDSIAAANFIASRWYSQIQSRLRGQRGMVFDKLQGQKFLCIDERVIVRFKRLSDNLETKNILTPQQLLWNRQLGLLGLPPIPRLVCGYQFNRFAMLPKAIYIALPTGLADPVNEWEWCLRGPDSAGSLQYPFPGPDQGDGSADADRQIG